MTVRTRFAPSPTGSIHLGNIRTALYSWLYARHCGGEFVLRIEDTDQERSTDSAVQLILDSLEWLGLDYDEGPYYQSKRLPRYREIAEQLLAAGLAYRCYCTKERIDTLREQQYANKLKPRYDGCCRDKNLFVEGQPHVIRFKTPQTGSVVFADQVCGKISIENSELDDLVLIKTDGFPTYNFGVVVDDWDMRITHVVRGADHINNTPRQINIFKALGAEPPVFAHLPLILGSDGKLLSKRTGAQSVMQYKADGYLPQAMLNYLSRLGWSHGDQEIFSRDELIKFFDISDINRAAAAFNAEKLLWLNRHYIKTLEPQIVAQHLQQQTDDLQIQTMNVDLEKSMPELSAVVVAQRDRSDTLLEMALKSRYFYEDFHVYEAKAQEVLQPECSKFLSALHHEFNLLTAWTDDSLHLTIENVAQQFDLKLGKVAQPLRVAVTGGMVSPPINVTLRLLGKKRVLERLSRAIEVCGICPI